MYYNLAMLSFVYRRVERQTLKFTIIYDICTIISTLFCRSTVAVCENITLPLSSIEVKFSACNTVKY